MSKLKNAADKEWYVSSQATFELAFIIDGHEKDENNFEMPGLMTLTQDGTFFKKCATQMQQQYEGEETIKEKLELHFPFK